jgi:hypothetical protein
MPDYIGTITLPGGITTNPDVLIRALYLLALGFSGLVFFAMLIMGGFRFLTAGGDEKAAADAQKTLTRAFIGLVIIVAAILILKLVGALFNIPGIQVV